MPKTKRSLKPVRDYSERLMHYPTITYEAADKIVREIIADAQATSRSKIRKLQAQLRYERYERPRRSGSEREGLGD